MQGRLTLVKTGANDNTILMPSNHAVNVEDRGDGKYSVFVAVMFPATVKLIVNMDKDLPGTTGELPPVQLVFVKATVGAPAAAPGTEDAAMVAEAAQGAAAEVGTEADGSFSRAAEFKEGKDGRLEDRAAATEGKASFKNKRLSKRDAPLAPPPAKTQPGAKKAAAPAVDVVAESAVLEPEEEEEEAVE